jgi:hypothetical protein
MSTDQTLLDRLATAQAHGWQFDNDFSESPNPGDNAEYSAYLGAIGAFGGDLVELLDNIDLVEDAQRRIKPAFRSSEIPDCNPLSSNYKEST